MSLPAIYAGTVWHKRQRPRHHSFRYPVFYLMLDVAALDAGQSTGRWLSFNRLNLFAVFRRDYGQNRDQRSGKDDDRSLFDEITDLLANEGASEPPDRVMMLTLPRVLGYSFNPITLYYCYRGDELATMVYEVHNTFGEKHFYLANVPLAPGNTRISPICHTTGKALYVSPFYPVAGHYRFHLRPPGETISLLIDYIGDDGKLDLTAGLRGTKFELNDANLLRLFLRIPLQTLKVTAAIYFEALRLWLKRIPLKPKHTQSNGGVSRCKDVQPIEEAS